MMHGHIVAFGLVILVFELYCVLLLVCGLMDGCWILFFWCYVLLGLLGCLIFGWIDYELVVWRCYIGVVLELWLVTL